MIKIVILELKLIKNCFICTVQVMQVGEGKGESEEEGVIFIT